MKLLLVIAAVLAVGSAAEEEQKTQAILVNPGFYNGINYAYGGLPYAHAGYAPYAHTYGYAPFAHTYAPVTYNTPVVQAPVIAQAPAPVVAPVAQVYAPTYAAPVPTFASNQFAAQDELGNSNYGYSNVNSAKHEFGNANTAVQGSYQYVDANGELQVVSYIADGLGFRTVDSRLPKPVEAKLEAPVFNLEAPVYNGIAPEPVEDTPEVAEAKAAFFKTFEETKNREKRESDPAIVYGYNSFYNYPGYNPNPYFYNGLLAYRNLGYPYIRNYGSYYNFNY